MGEFDEFERVERGARWLDSVMSGWWITFDLDRFALHDGCNCVVGQLADVEYDDAVDCSWLDLTNDLAHDLGLFAGHATGNLAEYQALEDEWRRVITERRAVTR